MNPHSVTLVYNQWGQDADGGRTVLSSTRQSIQGCDFSKGHTTLEVEDNLETGLRRVTMIKPASVAFNMDVSLNAHDEVIWTDRSGRQHIYVVTSYGADGARRDSYWIAWLEEKQ
jgi:hypothetical protein